MKQLLPLTVYMFAFTLSAPGWADHPNEGSLTLDALVQEALAHNPSLDEASSRGRAAHSDAKVARGALLPELSLEGGPVSAKLDSEKYSGTALYGKAQWNLYRGGRDQALLSQAQLSAEFAGRQTAFARSALVREVNKLYYKMLFFLESASLKEKALQMNREQMQLAKRKKASGFTSNADVIEFELREATLNADLKKILQERDEISRELAALLGRAQSSTLLTVKGHLQRDQKVFDPSKVLTALDESNPDLIEGRLNRDIALQERAVARSEFLPQIDMEARYGKLAAEDRLYADRDNYSVFLKMKLNLFSGFSSLNGAASAASRVAQSDAALSRTRLNVKAEAENLISLLSSISERLDLEEQTLQRSEEYYKLTLGEYRRGIKNSPDVVTASERLLETRIRNLEYRRDYQLARLRLAALTASN